MKSFGSSTETDNFLCQSDTALAAFCPNLGQSNVYTQLFTFSLYQIQLGFGIGRECIDSNYAGQFVYICDVAYMFQQVRKTFLQSLQVLLVQVCLRNAAVVFQSTNSSYDNNCVRFQTCHTALDIQEFLCTKVSTETSLCDGVISKIQSTSW